MLKSLKTIQIISDYLRERGELKSKVSSIADIYKFFATLQRNRRKFHTLYIFNYLFSFISSDEVAKRKASAAVFEDLLAVIFNATVADTKTRSNLTFEVDDYFLNVKDAIASNRREKADVVWEGGYTISLKTLIAKNSEINMGSFEKKVLFDGLRVDNYLSERKSNDGAGVGSRPQFLKLLSLVETLSSYDKFREKFNKMAEFIYSDDLLLVVKNNYQMELYFFTGSEIVEIFKAHSTSKERFLSLVNRYEGNSLRIDRDSLIAHCNKTLTLDFAYLKDSVIALINRFDYALHRSFVDYFSSQVSRQKTKNLIFNELENLFSAFDRDFEALA